MSDPLAYFLTWHTYGTWLQGESSGYVDRTHPEYGQEFVRPNTPLRRTHASRMFSEASLGTTRKHPDLYDVLHTYYQHQP